MKKYLLVIVAFMTVLLAACGEKVVGQEYDFSKDNRQPTTIRVWVDDSEGAMMKEMVEKFREVHPEVVVEWAHMGTVDAMNQLKLSGPSGNGADIFQFPHDQLATALRHNLLLPIPDDHVEELEDRMNETAMKVATACFDEEKANKGQNPFDCGENDSNRKVFAVPISVESVALFYNKDLVDEVPETWEQLLVDAKKYKDETGNNYINTNWNDSYFINFVLSAHGYIPFGENMDDPDNVNINSQAVINGLQWIKDNIVPYYGEGSSAPAIQALADKDFQEKKSPFIITGPWMIETYKNVGLNFGVTKIPTININDEDVAPKPFLGAQMLGVYAGSTKVEAALKFIKFWNSNEGLRIQYDHKGKLPALKDELLDQVPGVKDDEYLEGIRAQLENTIPMPTIAEVEHYWEPVRVMINDIWDGGLTPEAAAEKAEKAYDARRGLGQ